MHLDSCDEDSGVISISNHATEGTIQLQLQPYNCGSLDQLADLSLDERMALKQVLSEQFKKIKTKIIEEFELMSEDEQVNLAVSMLYRMRHSQHGQINNVLRPMLQRDFIGMLPAKGLSNLAETILSYLDAKSLCNAERVCKSWQEVIAEGQLWKKLIEHKVRYDGLWSGLSERRGWKRYLFISRDKVVKSVREAWKLADSYYIDRGQAYRIYNMSSDWTEVRLLHSFYRKLYPEIVCDIDNIEMNWKTGKHVLTRINCLSEASKGVYCLQYDDDKIVSGLRDNTIKVWDMQTKKCRSVLTGHTGSVLCLQYDERVIISGSSDATVRVWSLDGQPLNALVHHCEAVLHLRFQDGMMVTCSKDRSIAVWDMVNPQEITLRRVLVGHRAAVNVVDFDRTYIVSASGDRTIKVWWADTCEFVRTLAGHRRGIACLQYRDNLVVSGSSDNTIRLWHIESGQCLRILEGHEELVRCIRFDTKRIVSGAYDGKIKVWDLQAALDPRSPPGTICLRTLVEHTGRVFRLQFDDFQIVSSSHDDTILIWDFLNYRNPLPNDIPLVFSATPEILKTGHTEAINRARNQQMQEQAEEEFVEGDDDNELHFENEAVQEPAVDQEEAPAVENDDDEAPDQHGMDI